MRWLGLLAGLCCLSAVWSRTSDTDCPTALELVKRGCLLQCVTEEGDRGCITCNDTCVQACRSKAVVCDALCPHGYEVDDDGCQICECRDICENSADNLDCERSCMYSDENGCPQCRERCSESACDSDEDCFEGQSCLRVGAFGASKCVDVPGQDDMCTVEGDKEEEEEKEEEEDDRVGSSFTGANDRLAISDIGSVSVECRDGYRCSDSETCVAVEGPCRASGGSSCDDNGYYRPLQCRKSDNGFICKCVGRNGTEVDRTETSVTSKYDAPDCVDIVYGYCAVEVRGREYKVRHGQHFVNFETCERCRCNNGELVDCVAEETDGDNLADTRCDLTPDRPRDCVNVRGTGITIAHGEKKMFGRCNYCGCRDGSVICTRLPCGDDGDNDDDSKDEDSCDRCKKLPSRPICGLDGRTFRSRCFAKNCSGLTDDDYIPEDRPCISTDICRLYPCEAGEHCVQRGGVVCLRKRGCEPRKLRICVNTSQLMCRRDDNSIVDFAEREVCGKDDVTYPSVCRLLQDSADGVVKYGGRCDREECEDGPVCGTDGVTYENICVLRSRSSGVRVDYGGRCRDEDDDDTPIVDMCRNVRESGRCKYSADNCDRLVRPEDGCCPICGGVVVLALDRDALEKYAERNPDVDTLDELSTRLLQEDTFTEIQERCDIDISLSGDNIVMAFKSKTAADNKYCFDESATLVRNINSPPADNQIVYSVEYELVGAATAAPLESNDTDNGQDGASVAVVSLTVLLLSTLLAAFL